MKRSIDSCFVKYFDLVLLAWNANIDIQPVFKYYKSITQQTFAGLQDVFKTCPEDVFNTSSA